MRHVLMLLIMFGVWLLWSGHYSFDHMLVLGLGVVSCVFVVYMANRMDIVDEEGHPIHLLFQLLLYIPWLLWAIVKANIDVAKRVLNPSLPISPCMVRIKATQKTDLTRVIFANSITLTPGTVSVELVGDDILVHALTREAAEDVQSGDMDRRVTSLET
ncbi:MAG: Na+/H+ antiporter subunit E [Candidatus Latescibacteria bacterium]|nr:Na+/H+ antiporter subunit E [Candidatus Latescibacterota bacterium]